MDAVRARDQRRRGDAMPCGVDALADPFALNKSGSRFGVRSLRIAEIA